MLIKRKEFIATTLDPEDEVFIFHIASVSFDSDLYLFCRVHIALLKADKTTTAIPSKYAIFADVFSKDLAAKLPEHTGIINYTIELIKGQQPTY